MFSFSFFRALLPHEVSLSLLSPSSDHCTAVVLSSQGIVGFATDIIRFVWLNLFFFFFFFLPIPAYPLRRVIAGRCVGVSDREKEREGEKQRTRPRQSHFSTHSLHATLLYKSSLSFQGCSPIIICTFTLRQHFL